MSDPMIGGGRPPMPPMGGGGPPMGGGPPGAPPGGPGKQSLLNPTDMAMKSASGAVRPGMTVAEFLQKNFGVSPNDPIEKFIQAAKGQAQNRTVMGKMGGPPQGARPPMGGGRPPMGGGAPPAGPMGGAPPSLDSIAGRM